ncbi:hypothetical protein ABPG72_007312 [Tetrahymena utriculariae]
MKQQLNKKLNLLNQNQGAFFKVQQDVYLAQLETKNMNCHFASIVNENLDMFICEYDDRYEIYQIISSQASLKTKSVQSIVKQIYKNYYTDDYKYYIPIDENISSLYSLSQFKYTFNYPSDLVLYTTIIYNKKIYFVFKSGNQQINLFIYNLQDLTEGSKQISSQGYTNELSFQYQEQGTKNSFICFRNRYYSTNIQKTSIGFIQEQHIPLPFYQYPQVQKSIIINQQIIQDDQFQSINLMKRIINSECLIMLVYITLDDSQILQIIDICFQVTIFQQPVPYLFIDYIDNKQDFAQLIVEFNYIIFYYYKILYDLTNNVTIDSFSNVSQAQYQNTLWILNDRFTVIDNYELKTQFFDLKTHTYQDIFFQQESVNLVTENIENQFSVLFVDNFQYFYFLDSQKIKAFSLDQMSFSIYELTQQQFLNNIELRLFQLTSNQLILFSQFSIVVMSSNLQIISINPQKYLSRGVKKQNLSIVFFRQQQQSSLKEQIYNSLQVNILQTSKQFKALIQKISPIQVIQLAHLIVYINKTTKTMKHIILIKAYSKAIIQTNIDSIWIVDYINNFQQKINLSLEDSDEKLSQYMILCEDNLILQYTPYIIEFLIKEGIKNPVQYYCSSSSGHSNGLDASKKILTF